MLGYIDAQNQSLLSGYPRHAPQLQPSAFFLLPEPHALRRSRPPRAASGTGAVSELKWKETDRSLFQDGPETQRNDRAFPWQLWKCLQPFPARSLPIKGWV